MELALPSDDGYLRAQTASRLPTFRRVDLRLQGGVGVEAGVMDTSTSSTNVQHQQHQHLTTEHDIDDRARDNSPVKLHNRNNNNNNNNNSNNNFPNENDPRPTATANSSSHTRYHSSSNIAPSDLTKPLPTLPRSKTFNCGSDFDSVKTVLDREQAGNNTLRQPPPPATPTSETSKAQLSGRNESEKYRNRPPPPAMITQRSFPVEVPTTTQVWVASQQSPNNPDIPSASPAHPKLLRSSTDGSLSRPLIQPIRGFKPSSRRSVEMASASKRISVNDPDNTLRALDSFEAHRGRDHPEPEEQNSDESDLFLRAAREEELAQQVNNSTDSDRLIRTDKRRSQIGQRAPVLQANAVYHPSSTSRRRGSDNEGSTISRTMDDPESIGQALTYRPGPDRSTALEDINKSRYNAANSRSNPVTPRAFTSREISPESQGSFSGRRPSFPEQNVPVRASYRQSNLSYSTPRIYNSSPLVSRSADMQVQDNSELQRAADGTASTVSTTAPSTVWDELEELKSRIHRLELTGKMPTTSGAAVSRASNERPPTATTTVTTVSSSPKRARNNSISPTDSAIAGTYSETHPLLSSALAKSKGLLNPEVYRTLEAAAADALAITAMMGTSGQPGPISSSQSTVGGLPTVSDRQVRRKADSMCRSLTELCLALSEGKNDQTQVNNHATPNDREEEVRQSIEPNNGLRQGLNTDIARVKSSPRALSRLEARRSSLLTGSSLPSARGPHSEGNTPTQLPLAGRRTSLLLRSSRRGTEEPEDEDETRFRAPSRANTDIGRVRNAPREYVSQQPLPDRLPERFQERLPERPTSIQSSLPVRRHYTSSSLPNNGQSTPPVSSLGGRRYLDRSTPERDTTSVAGRIAEDRAQRKSSVTQSLTLNRTGSLTRKTRQPNSADFSAGQNGGYQLG